MVAALGVPAGVYNAVDDEPLRRDEFAAVLAAAVGRRRLRVGPRAAGALMGSRSAVLTRSNRVSNRRLREASDWAPRVRSAREGWPEMIAALRSAGEVAPPPAPGRGLLRGLLGVLGLSALTVGLWAQLAPRSFYDSFPGLGRHWVAVDGVFNEHLIRDVGGLQLALALTLLAAAVTLSPPLVRTAALAALVFALPHLAYHLGHLDTLAAADGVANVVVLGLAVVLPLGVLGLARRGQPRTLWSASAAMPAASVVMYRSPR